MKSLYIWGEMNPIKAMDGIIKDKQEIVIKDYIFQKSFFCVNLPGINIPEDMVMEKNVFWQKQLLCDFNKEYSKRVFDDPADYILIDALSCILPVAKVEYKGIVSKVTNTYAMTKCCKTIKDLKLSSNEYFYNKTDDEIKSYLYGFCEKLKKSYPVDKIIINRVNYPLYYSFNNTLIDNGLTKDSTRLKNYKFIEKIYDFLEKNLKGCNVIKALNSNYCEDKKSSFAFSKEYMIYLCQNIYSIMGVEEEKRLELIHDSTEYLMRQKINLNEGNKIIYTYNAVQNIIDEYEYKLELYNQKFRRYEEKFNELYTFVLGYEVDMSKFDKDQLSFADFVVLKKDKKLLGSDGHSKFWYRFIYPFTQIGHFKNYCKKYGFKKAIAKAKSVYKAKN